MLVQDLERLAEEDREIGGKLAGTKVVLDQAKKDVVEAETNLKRIEEKIAEQEKMSPRVEEAHRRRGYEEEGTASSDSIGRERGGE